MSKFDIFISYRRSVSADKAEHLMSLLEKAGYKGRISFDRENLTGIFDIELLKRIDACKDFVLLVGPGTFKNAKENESEKYQRLATMSIREFDTAQREMMARNETLDFVRLEVVRALAGNKNIVIVAESPSKDFDFNKLSMPSDLKNIKRSQAVFYYNDKNFRFRSILGDVVKLIKSRKGGLTTTMFFACGIGVMLALLGLFWYFGKVSELAGLSTYKEIKDFSMHGPMLGLKGKTNERLHEFEKAMDAPLTTDNASEIASAYQVALPDSAILRGTWSEDVTLDQIKVIRNILDKMKKIGPVTFTLGAHEIPDNENKIVTVSLNDPFYINQYELSKGEWIGVLGGIDPGEKESEMPVTDVTWEEANGFVDYLNAILSLDGWMFSLPTDAQWEYAASSDKRETSYPSKLSKRGELLPNSLDLYDMTGNVKEWCLDGYSSEYNFETFENPIGKGIQKVVKGASYKDVEFMDEEPWIFSPHYRDGMHPDKKAEDVGFRIALIKVL